MSNNVHHIFAGAGLALVMGVAAGCGLGRKPMNCTA